MRMNFFPTVTCTVMGAIPSPRNLIILHATFLGEKNLTSSTLMFFFFGHPKQIDLASRHYSCLLSVLNCSTVNKHVWNSLVSPHIPKCPRDPGRNHLLIGIKTTFHGNSNQRWFHQKVLQEKSIKIA